MLRNGFYNAVAGLIRMGLALLTIPLLIQFMGVETYGLWALVSAIVGLVSLAEAGLSTATTVFVSQDLGRNDQAGLSQTLTVTIGAMLSLATVATIALWLSAETIVHWFPKLNQSQQSTAIQALQMSGLVIWSRLLQQVLIGVEQAYQRYGLLNILNTIQWVLTSLGIWIVAYQGGQIVALMIWQALVSGVALLSHIWMVRSLLRSANLHFNWNSKKALAVARYSLMTWLTSLGGALFARGDRLIVGSLLGSQMLGIYAAITDITGAINGLSALPVQPLLPALSQVTIQRSIEGEERLRCDRVKLHQQVKQALEINGLVALGFGATLFMLAPFVMQTMIGGAASSETVMAFRLAVIIYSLYSVNAVGYYVLFSVNGLRQSMSIHLMSGVLALILISIGAHSFGLMGAILGNSGYLGVWLLTIVGMKHLNIAANLWMKWLSFPIIWFLGTTIVGFFLMNQQGLIFCIAFFQFGILLKWFVDSQPQSVHSVFQQFKANRS